MLTECVLTVSFYQIHNKKEIHILFQLKPYVSYRAPEVVQTEFTAKDLFDAVYSKKIVEDFKNGKLDADGKSLEPSPEEALEPGEAVVKARKTGSDIFGP